MRRTRAAVVLGVALGLSACAQPEPEWMKLNQKYTTVEFRRDHADCSRGGKLDERCMRDRGWVSVSPQKGEKGPEPESRIPPYYVPPSQRSPR